MRQLRSGLAILTLLLAQVAVLGCDELLQTAVEGHRASREAITTLSCRLTFSLTITRADGTKGEQAFAGDFWYRPGTVRCRYTNAAKDLTIDYLWRDGIRLSLHQKKGSAGANKDRIAVPHFGRENAFVRGLLVLNRPGTIEHFPLEALVAKATTARAKRVISGGKALVLISLTLAPDQQVPDEWKVEVELDPNVNYLVRQVQYTSSGKDAMVRRESVSMFSQHEGVYFPGEAEGRDQSETGKFDSSYRTKLLDVLINRPLPPEAFNFGFPRDILMADNIRGELYRINERGEQSSATSVALDQHPPPPNAPVSDGRTPAVATQEESHSLLSWLLPASVLILLLAAALAVYRRLRPGN